MNLRTLRDQTQEQHDAVEALLPVTDPELDRERYGQILQCFYRVVQGWETWFAEHAPPSLTALVNERRRAGILLHDLGSFGLLPLPAAGETLDGLQSLLAGVERASPEYEAGFLGAMYVMEGSTLGGQYIARHVEQVLGLTPGQGDAYFRGYGEQTGAMWNAFREVLAAIPDEYTSLVVSAARATFAYVQNTMRCCPAVLGAAPHAVPQRVSSAL